MKTFWKGLRIRTWMFFVLGCILVLIAQLSKSQSEGVIGGIGLFVWFIGFIDMIFGHGEREAPESFEEKSNKVSSHSLKNQETHKLDLTPLYLNLDKHFHRLLEIEEALAEVGSMFENFDVKPSAAGENTELQEMADTVNKLRIPGFFAYHLAEEGSSLLHILAAASAVARRNESYKYMAHLDSIVQHMDEVEPILRQTLHEMEPYKNMDAKEAVEVLAKRFAQGRKG